MQSPVSRTSTEHPSHMGSERSGGVRISVVAATFNRRESLSHLLDSLWNQSLGRESFEVIIVSDGSTDGTADLVESRRAKWPNLRFLETDHRGPGCARNTGSAAARGDYIAFTDDDCVPAADWLERLLAAFASTGAVAVQGKTTTDRAARTPLTHQVEVLAPMLTSVPTCNAGYLKKAFDAAGGFDESFRYAHDEDADLAWRVEELGRIVFAAEVLVDHPPRNDGFWKRARWLRGLESEFLLFQNNPAKYRRYVSPSPWWTIYWNVFVIGQIGSARSSCRYLIKPFRPDYFCVGMALVAARWFNLLRFFPQYVKARKHYSSVVPARHVKAESASASR